MKDIPPFFTEHLYFTIRDIIKPDVPDKCTVNTSFFHRVKIVDYPFFRNVVGDPVPVDTGLNGIWWRNKTGFKSRTGYFSLVSLTCCKEQYSNCLLYTSDAA